MPYGVTENEGMQGRDSDIPALVVVSSLGCRLGVEALTWILKWVIRECLGSLTIFDVLLLWIEAVE